MKIKFISLRSINQQIKRIKTERIFLIIDRNVWDLYHDKMVQDERIIVWIAPAGEGCKNFIELEKCIEFFLEKGVRRSNHLVAIGGGAISDFAGLVASLLLRGISWSIVPTTLLSMVDAMVGGKVAINSRHGKNLIGAFYLPKEAWVNIDFLSTLSTVEMESGKGEIVKYGLLDQKIYRQIMRGDSLVAIVQRCIAYKNKIIKKDFRERKKRKILNLGHTFGHALEKYYHLPHGISVIWGMFLLFTIFDDQKNLVTLKKLIDKIGVTIPMPPWERPNGFPIAKIKELIVQDKKMLEQDRIDIVLIKKIGLPFIKTVSVDELFRRVEKIFS